MHQITAQPEHVSGAENGRSEPKTWRAGAELSEREERNAVREIGERERNGERL
jgi:hypothetical protein